MTYAICLLRVSSDKQFQEGQGIDNQKGRCDYYANQHGISIVQYFYEHYSGRKTERLVLDNMLDLVKSNPGDISLLIVGNIDRFTRAGADSYLQLKKLFAQHGVEVVDASGVIQKTVNTLADLGVSYDWSERSPSRLAEVLMAETANSEATDILTRCIGGQIRKARKGYQFNAPLFGYRNEKRMLSDGKKASLMIPYEEEAQFIRSMFEMRAEGMLSDEEICQRINVMGFKTRSFNKYDPVTREVIGQSGNNLLTPKYLQRFISKTIYCGFRSGKWTEGKLTKIPYEQALVSLEVFNRANRGKVYIGQLGDEYHLVHNRIEYKNLKDTQDFMFRHVVKCPHCQESFVGSKSKGKGGKYFGYYHCSRNHKYYGVNQTEFENTVANTIKRITFKKKYLGLLKEVARDVWVQKNKRQMDEKQSIQNHVDTMSSRQDTLVRRIEKTESDLVRTRLEQEFEDIEKQIQRANIENYQMDITQEQIEHYFATLKSVMEHPEKWLLQPTAKAILTKTWNLVFAKPPTYREIKNGTPELSLVFKLSRGSKVDKRQLVQQLSLQWNTFCKDVMKLDQNLV